MSKSETYHKLKEFLTEEQRSAKCGRKIDSIFNNAHKYRAFLDLILQLFKEDDYE